MSLIAIIDDSPIVLDILKEALTGAGYDVVTMTEPSRSVLLESRPPDLVLLDIKMPQAFGDDIARFMREAWGLTVPIYLFSSLPEQELAQRAREAGASGYICKEWGINLLLEIVNRVLLPPQWMDMKTGPIPEDEIESARPKPAPPREPVSSSLYTTFAARSEERRAKVQAALAQAERGDQEVLKDVAFQVHDWIGEARLLGFEKLAAAITDLNEVLTSWKTTFRLHTQGAQLFSWVNRLADISRRFATEPPSDRLLQDMKVLRSDLNSEMWSGEFGAEPTPVTQQSKAAPDQRRILIFDDSPIICEVLSLELTTRGHIVALAGSLFEFERSLVEFRPDVIFLDINMPEVSGDNVCRDLRTRGETEHVPIVLLSSLPDEELAQLAQAAGATGYLSKQRGMDELIKYLDELLTEIIF
jgi:CheY-like chemotaxis protein